MEKTVKTAKTNALPQNDGITLESICRMVDTLPGTYLVFEADEDALHYLYHCGSAEALTGMPDAELRKISDPYKIVLEDDRSMIRRAINEFRASEETLIRELLFRMIHIEKGFIWVHMSVKKYAVVDGKLVYLASLVDVTKETMISYALMDSSDRSICVIERSTKRILYGNANFYDLIDSNPATVVGQHCYEHLCKVLEMKYNDNCLCYSSLNADPPIETYNAEKKLNLTITGREVVWGEYDAYVFYMTDITERKRQQEALEDSQKRFEVALENSELMVWEYDMVNNRCIASQKALSNHNIPLIIENYPESLYTMGHTPPETVEQIKECKRRLQNGETGFSVERRTLDKNGRSEWQKVEYTLECDADGKPVRAIVCGLDITAQKELEEKYEEQMEYRNKLAQNAMFSVRLDLDDDSIEDYTATDDRLKAIVEASHGAAELLHNFFKTSMFTPESGITREMLTKEALIETYALGQSQYRTEYRCTLLKLYFDLNLTIYKNPGTGHLEVFYVITDVTGAALTQNGFRRVVELDYDFVAVADPKTGKLQILAHAEKSPMPQNTVDGAEYDYDTVISEFAEGYREYYLTEGDYRAATDGMRLSHVMEVLESQPVYEFICRAKIGKGTVQTFRMRFGYTDANRDRIVFTRSNISHVVEAEQKNQRLLEAALQAAKKANQAKTDFLSRMSHDMRTPMNAIIGLSALTLDDAENPEVVRDNMSKMRASSDFLLGLVNDILDLAKIEDGAVSLKPEVYTYNDFLSTMKTMFRPQCDAKGITLTFKPAAINPKVRVDKMRINQIFFNVFSNAVKYTPAGGHIDYTVENLTRTGSCLAADLVIKDTGIGMSEEYQKHLFEPFAQENSDITPELQGSGLGLSITKQLVDLMGGKITITSKKNVGTTVRLHFDFDCLETDAQIVKQEVQARGDASVLVGKHILLAEDHPLNAQIARRLLEKKQVIVHHAANGRIALDMFRASEPYSIDAILMDIRMPELSGLDAARAIRALDRPDGKSVVILAMSANAYEEDVKKSLDAGMNGHLAKPVEPAVLYEALIRELTHRADG